MTTILKLLVCILCCSAGNFCAAQNEAVIHFKDGHSVTVDGTLRLRYRGWRSAFLIESAQPYTIDFQSDDRPSPSRLLEIELNLNGDVLVGHVGEQISATGNMQINGTSPYYWNGAMLMADLVHFADGSVYHRNTEQKPSVPPKSVHLFLFTVIMTPRTYDWPHQATDILTGKLLLDSGLAGCSLNGGGDVLNCSCADGFVPIRAGIVSHPHPSTEWRQVPKANLIFPGMAQFVLPDKDALRPLTYQLVCKRKEETRQ